MKLGKKLLWSTAKKLKRTKPHPIYPKLNKIKIVSKPKYLKKKVCSWEKCKATTIESRIFNFLHFVFFKPETRSLSKPCLNEKCERRACTKHQFHICKNCIPKIENGPLKLVQRSRGNRKYHCMHRKGIVTGKYSRICMLRSIGRFDKILKLDSSVSSCEFIHIVKDIYMPDLIASLKCKTGDMMEAINFLSVRRISLKRLRFEIRRFQPKI